MCDKDMIVVHLLCLILVLSVVCTSLAAQADSLSQPADQVQSGQFTRAFNKALDPASWTVSNGTWEPSRAIYRPENVILQGDISRLKIFRLTRPRMKKDYSAASITTRQLFGYGTFTARLRAATPKGVAAGFLLMNPPIPGGNHQEICTILGGPEKGLLDLDASHQPAGSAYPQKAGGLKPTAIDFRNEYHDFTVVWSSDRVTWLVDGVEVQSVSSCIPDLGLQIGFFIQPTWGNMAYKIDDSQLPAYLDVQWVNYIPESAGQ